MDNPEAVKLVSSEATIVELREKAGKLIVDSIESLDQFWFSDYADYDKAYLQVGYTWNASGVVDVIYVVNQKYGTVTLTEDVVGDMWNINGVTSGTAEEVTFEDNGTIALGYTGNNIADGMTVMLAGTYDSTNGDKNEPFETTGVYDAKTKTVYMNTSFIPRGNYNTDIVFTKAYKAISVDASALEDFTLRVKVDGTDSTESVADNKWSDDDLGLATTNFEIVLKRDTVADGTTATLSYTVNGEPKTKKVTFGVDHNIFVNIVDEVKGNADVVITGIEATYTLRLGKDDNAEAAKNYNFSEDANGNVIVADDVLEITGVVPGDVTTIYIQRHGTFPATTDTNDILEADFGTVVDQESVEAIGNLSVSGKVFTFKVVLGSNASTINVIKVGAANEVTTA